MDDVVALIKPQFEAGREQVGKKGIVRDTKVHEAVVEKIVDFALKEGYNIEGLHSHQLQVGMEILNF